MIRSILFLVSLAFAGSLLMVGCEPPAETPKTPPKVDAPKTPATPAAPATPAVPEKPKTSAAPGVPGAVGAVIAAATCAKEGCGKPGIAAITLTKDGKPLTFCCNGCMADYKKANNIQ